MLKKEHIRQAIEAISKRDTEIGYTLDEMLSTGRIALVKPHLDSPPGEDFHFLFDGIPVTIKRIIFFNAGTAPIEERLLIKYGEMAKKQHFSMQTKGMNFHAAARDIRASGIKFMVLHEIGHALKQLKRCMKTPDPDFDSPMDGSGMMDIPSDEPDKWQQTIHGFELLKTHQHDLSAYLPSGECDAGPKLCFQGEVNRKAPALFIRFPYCMDALMQVAELNLEFFHVRFLLSCLVKGLGDRLFACVVDGRIEGMVYLTFKKFFFYRAMEIQYIATARGRKAIETESTSLVPKGVGTVLIAGVWMVWKTLYREAKDLLLDSEVGARSFYETVGFQSRGFSEFALKHPKGRLVTAILDMAARCPDLPEGVVDDISSIVKEQFRILRKNSRRQHIKSKRQLSLDAIKTCFQSGAHPVLTETAMRELNRHQSAIPESADLFRLADERK
jgi:hypothetical protein